MIKEFDLEANVLKEKVKNLILDMHVSNTITILKRDVCLILVDIKNIKEFMCDVKKLREKGYINNVIEYEYVNILLWEGKKETSLWSKIKQFVMKLVNIKGK
jgi:hypothetical protein